MFPRFSLTSPLSQEREKSSHPVFTMCGEPWSQPKNHESNQCILCYFFVQNDKSQTQVMSLGFNSTSYKYLCIRRTYHCRKGVHISEGPPYFFLASFCYIDRSKNKLSKENILYQVWIKGINKFDLFNVISSETLAQYIHLILSVVCQQSTGTATLYKKKVIISSPKIT